MERKAELLGLTDDLHPEIQSTDEPLGTSTIKLIEDVNALSNGKTPEPDFVFPVIKEEVPQNKSSPISRGSKIGKLLRALADVIDD